MSYRSALAGWCFLVFAHAVVPAQPEALEAAPAPAAADAPTTATPELPALAVADFAVFGEGLDESNGRAVSELLLHQLDAGRYRLVERQRLSAVMQELTLQSSDLVESAERAADVGKLAGVERLVSGSLVRFGSTLRLMARLVRVETGEIEGRGQVAAATLDELAMRIPALAAQLGLGGEGAPPVATPPHPSAFVPADRVTWELDEDVRVTLLRVPGGVFNQGSPLTESGRQVDEGPPTEVTLSQDFYLGATEITVAQFAAFARATGYRTQAEREGWSNGSYQTPGDTAWRRIEGLNWRNAGFPQDADHPVVNVSWYDADEFCRWLSARTGWRVALPTEAQWEYACRAGTRTRYSWGETEEEGFGHANGADASASWQYPGWVTFPWQDGWVHTSPAGIFEPNAFGLHDMHGNVWEWCGDWYLPRLQGGRVLDPKGPTTGTRKVYRGGSWDHMPPRLRSAHREKDPPSERFFNLGFRIAATKPN